MRIYLAGPMRGYPEYNFPAFREAAAFLRAAGHEVVSPAELDDAIGGPEFATLNIKDTFRRDLDALLQQDAIVLLPGWTDSRGAILECHAAQVCGLPAFTLEIDGAHAGRLTGPLNTFLWEAF